MSLKQLSSAVSLSFLLMSATCFAQLTTATILGTVTDSTGAVLANAKVEVQNTGTSATVQLITDQTGGFLATALPVGTYRVTVTAVGFKTLVQQGLQLSVADRLNLPVMLVPGAVSEEVVVTGRPELVDTTSTTLGGVVTTEQVQDLPLNGRSVTQLIALIPGAVFNGPQRSVSGAAEGRLFESGMKFLVDGGDSGQVDSDLTDGGYYTAARITRASVDAVSEFRVVDTMYSAEYGQSIGSVINFITKSGTNQIHGSVFEYFRNEVLDAHDWFNDGPKPAIRLNQFGGSVGGPIIKDKLFFFGNYEGVRQRTGVTQQFQVPDAALRSTISGEQLALVNTLPLPNSSQVADPGLGWFIRTTSNQLTENTGMVKIDYQATSKDHITGRYNANKSYTLTYFGIADGQARAIPALLQTFNVSETHTFSPSVLNEVGFAINRLWTHDAAASTPETSALPIVWLSTDPSVSTIGPSIYDLPVANTSWTYLDTLSWNKGRHQMKFGTQIVRNQDNKTVSNQNWSLFLSPTGGTAAFAFDGGVPYENSSFGWPDVGMRGTYNNFFAEDNFKVNDSITLNLGLRYQYDTAPTESQNRIANFNPVTGTVNPEGSSVLNAPKTNFAPRFGIAYAPFASKKTVIRTGFGIFYPSLNPAEMQYFPTNLPNFGRQRGVTVFDWFNKFGNYNMPAFPFPDLVGLGFDRTLASAPQDWKAPRSEQWNLNIQQGFGANTVLEVGYKGNISLFLNPGQELNPIEQPSGVRRYPGFLGIANFPNCCSANYNALQVSFKQRPWRGVTFDVNYTYSHSQDHGGLTFGAGMQDPSNFAAEYATSDYDVRHNLEFDYTVDLPGPRNGMVGRVLGGWQVNGITVMRSGLPVNIVCGCDPTGMGDANGRPDGIPGVSRRPSNYSLPGNQINPLAFTTINAAPGSPQYFPVAPAAGYHFGDLPRNAVEGPSAFNWDFSLFKNIRFSESRSLQFRTEFFNIFNTPQFANPIGDTSSSALGQSLSTITSAGGFGSNRQIQFALKYLF
jgi:hypothetical protein